MPSDTLSKILEDCTKPLALIVSGSPSSSNDAPAIEALADGAFAYETSSSKVISNGASTHETSSSETFASKALVNETPANKVLANLPTLHLLKQLEPYSSSVIAVDSGASVALRAGLTINTVVGDLDSLDSNCLAKLKQSNTTIIAYDSNKDETDLELALEHVLAHTPLPRQSYATVAVANWRGGRLDHELASLGAAAKQLLIQRQAAQRHLTQKHLTQNHLAQKCLTKRHLAQKQPIQERLERKQHGVAATENSTAKTPSHSSLFFVAPEELVFLVAAGDSFCVGKYVNTGTLVSVLPLAARTVTSEQGFKWELDRVELDILDPKGVSNIVTSSNAAIKIESGIAAIILKL